MYLTFRQRVTQKKFELILKYVNSLRTREQTPAYEKVATAEYDEILQLFKQNNIPIPDTSNLDPDIIMILFYLTTTYPTAKAPLLTIRMGTKDEDICFVRN
jgi:hypothetical protein